MNTVIRLEQVSRDMALAWLSRPPADESRRIRGWVVVRRYDEVHIGRLMHIEGDGHPWLSWVWDRDLKQHVQLPIARTRQSAVDLMRVSHERRGVE